MVAITSFLAPMSLLLLGVSAGKNPFPITQNFKIVASVTDHDNHKFDGMELTFNRTKRCEAQVVLREPKIVYSNNDNILCFTNNTNGVVSCTGADDKKEDKPLSHLRHTNFKHPRSRFDLFAYTADCKKGTWDMKLDDAVDLGNELGLGGNATYGGFYACEIPKYEPLTARVWWRYPPLSRMDPVLPGGCVDIELHPVCVKGGPERKNSTSFCCKKVENGKCMA
ncbi:Fc.00g047310.m01.CDS01 [Cosmosporella sp. VM-42]